VLSCVGADEFDVGPGDLVCTPAGTEHDIVAVYGSDVVLFFIEEAVPAGGGAGGRRCRAQAPRPVHRLARGAGAVERSARSRSG
jgi:hypothetical protein